MKKMFIMVLSVVAVCLAGRAVGGEVSLSMILAMQTTHPQFFAFEKLAEKYVKEKKNVKIEILTFGSETEAVLKARMAANDLSDLWSTHGWSYMRYREYLEPMQNQPWAKDVSPFILPAIAGKEGDFYVLPMDIEISGISYNVEVLQRAGIDPDSIGTWEELGAALEKIKNAGMVPMVIAGKDLHPIGCFFIWAGQAFLAADPKAKADFDDLLNGKFPAQKWHEILAMLVDFRDKGYFNKNAVTASLSEAFMEMARGAAGFTMYPSNSAIVEALTYNPNAKFGFIPIPAARKDTEPTLMTGERAAIGVWKDSPNKEAALDFVKFLAQPDSIYAVASAGGNPAGLVSATSDTGALKDYYAKYANTKTYPVFDRAYLPSGMWDTLCTVGAAILAGSMTADEGVAKTEAEFNRLYKQ